MSIANNIRAGAAYVEVTAETSKLQRNLTSAQVQLQSFGRVCTMIGKDLLMLSEKHDAWDIYARGITMGINQVEQEGTKRKVMRYKPRNIAELAAFVAAVITVSLLNSGIVRISISVSPDSVYKLIALNTCSSVIPVKPLSPEPIVPINAVNASGRGSEAVFSVYLFSNLLFDVKYNVFKIS